MDRSHAPGLTRTDFAAIFVLAALAIALRLIPGLRIIDDAYITYRYARNIAHGIGFVYNPGEAVLGTTTPLYTLLLTWVGWITRSEAYPAVSVLINALADGINTALLYVIARYLLDHRLPGVVLGLLWAVAPASVTFAVGGMETGITIALMLGAFAAWLNGCTPLSAALTALATLARPDTLIWAGPLALAMMAQTWVTRRDRHPLARLPWAEAGVYVAILLPWLIYGTITFGSPLTNSVAAKTVAYHLPPTHALVALIQHFSTPFFEFDAFGPAGAIAGSIIYPLLALLGGLFLFHADRRSLPLAGYPWLFAVIYAIANPLMFRWYSTPTLPLYFLCIIAGVWGLVGRLAGRLWGKNRKAGYVPSLLVAGTGVFWLATSLNAWTLHPDHGPDRPAPEMAWFRLELLYEQAGRDLAPLITDDTVVASADIGAVGWYSGARILDTLGLVSPEAIAYYPIDPSMLGDMPYAVAPDLILDELPDYVVILETYGRNGLLRDPRFIQTYRLYEVIDTDIYNSAGMLIFERMDR